MVEYLLALVIDERVVENVAQIDRFDAPLVLGMVLDQQPADVRVEESSSRVVRVGVRVAELVVSPMVTHPTKNIVLYFIHSFGNF